MKYLILGFAILNWILAIIKPDPIVSAIYNVGGDLCFVGFYICQILDKRKE